MAKSSLLLFAVSLSFVLLDNLIEGNELPENENYGSEKQLRQFKKPAGVKTTKKGYGAIYDCVDFHKQPAFDHPLLKNQTFHFEMKSNYKTKKIYGETYSGKQKSSILIKLGGIGCPFGTIPIKRITKDDLIREKQLSKMYGQNIHTFTKKDSGLHVYYRRVGPKFGGAQARLSIHQTPFVGPLQFSSGLIKLSNGDDHIKAGWMVNPPLYGDNRTRLFTYLHTGTLRCFNARCPGFILVNPDIPLDLPFPDVSIPGIKTADINFLIYQDPINGNWWLNLGENDTEIGFWPKHIFKDLTHGATELFWGGEIFSLPKIPSSPMGSGMELKSDPMFDAYCRTAAFISGHTFKVIDANSVKRTSDFSTSYAAVNSDFRKSAYWKCTVMFGGPGGILGE